MVPKAPNPQCCSHKGVGLAREVGAGGGGYFKHRLFWATLRAPVVMFVQVLRMPTHHQATDWAMLISP